jgi:hypothetical protein
LAQRFGHGFDKTEEGLQMHSIVKHFFSALPPRGDPDERAY